MSRDELRERYHSMVDLANDAAIAHLWFARHLGPEVINMTFAQKCEVADIVLKNQREFTDSLIDCVAELTARVAELEA